MRRRDPFVGFGDDTNSSAKFQVVHEGRGRLEDWEGGERRLSHHDIGNGQVVVQRHGYSPWTISLRLLFDDADALELLASLSGESATLRYLWGITRRAGGSKQTILDTDYLVLPDTMLVDLTDREGHLSGPCVATATFWRAYVPSPYVGFTIVGSDT